MDANCNTQCPVARTAKILDGKWTTLIIRELLDGSRHFAEIQRGIGHISPRLLTARLRMLEEEAILERVLLSTKPLSTNYSLTAHGRKLVGVIDAMAEFGFICLERDVER